MRGCGQRLGAALRPVRLSTQQGSCHDENVRVTMVKPLKKLCRIGKAGSAETSREPPPMRMIGRDRLLRGVARPIGVEQGEAGRA